MLRNDIRQNEFCIWQTLKSSTTLHRTPMSLNSCSLTMGTITNLGHHFHCARTHTYTVYKQEDIWLTDEQVIAALGVGERPVTVTNDMAAHARIHAYDRNLLYATVTAHVRMCLCVSVYICMCPWVVVRVFGIIPLLAVKIVWITNNKRFTHVLQLGSTAYAHTYVHTTMCICTLHSALLM